MIFKREFSRNFKSLMIWSLALGGLVFLVLSIYPQMAEQSKGINDLLDVYPEAMKKAFGIGELDFSTLIGFYSLEAYLMTTLFGSIFAAMLASNILAKEVSEKTIEFLLSKPITRTRVVTEKLLVVVVNIVILNGFAILMSVLGFQLAKDAELAVGTFVLLVVATFLLHLTFAAVSFLLSSIMRRSRNILSASLGLVLVSYFLHIIAGISDQLQWLKYFSLFKYVDAAGIVNNQSLEPLYMSIMGAIISGSIVAAYLYYLKKDIVV